MWAIRSLIYIGAVFLTLQVTFYIAWQNPPLFISRTFTSWGFIREEPRKLVLFGITYVGYKMKNSYRSGDIQVAAVELYGDHRNISFFMEPTFSLTRGLGEEFIHLDEEPKNVLQQNEGLQKLVNFFQDVRGASSKKLLLFSSTFKNINRKLNEFFTDADMLEDLRKHVFAVGEWYYVVLRSYYEKYSVDAEMRFHREVTTPVIAASEAPRPNSTSFLENALAVQIPFLTNFEISAEDFEPQDLRIISEDSTESDVDALSE